MEKKMNLKKSVCILLAGIMMAGMCASCGQKTSESGKVSLGVSDWPATEGERLELFNQNKADFKKIYPDVEIVPDTWGFDIKSFYPKAEAGMLPNIYTVPFTEIDKLVDGEYVIDMTDALKEKGYYDNMNEKIRDIVSYEGRVYALPYEAYTFGIAYNTDVFEECGLVEADGTPMQPATWEEWAEMAVTIKEKTGKPGIVLMTANNCGGWMFTNIAWSYGVDFMEQQADGSWKATFNTPEAAAALQFIKDLRWKYDVLPANVLVNQAEMYKTYATGGAAMMMTAPLCTPALASYEMKPEMFGMFAVPAGPVKRVSLVGGGNRVLSNKTNEAQTVAALDWIDFIGLGYRMDDSAKETMEKNIQSNVRDGIAVGVQSLSIWHDDSEKTAYQNELLEKYYNMKPNAVKLYNESLNNSEIELQPEEPVCAQDLYAVLDTCIQQVLNDENADCMAIMEKANKDFQVNYLDNVDY